MNRRGASPRGAEGYKGYTTSPLFRLLPRVVRAGHGGSVGEAPTRIDRPIQSAVGIMAWIRGCRTVKRTKRESCEGAKDRKSVGEGKSVSVSVDVGGRGIIKKKKRTETYCNV